jgi:peptide chain release factor 2
MYNLVVMIELEDLIKNNNDLSNRFKELQNSVKINELKERLESLENETTKQEFWSDSENSAKVLSEVNSLKKKITIFNNIEKDLESNFSFIELLETESDDEIQKELEQSIKKLSSDIDSLEISTLLSGKYDKNNAIITIHPGAGGTEAMDWADMLYRMYTRWGLANGFKVQELDFEPGEEAGAKSVSFLVSGEYAYGYLKSEHGVHRLVRISPFDAGGRRHTSFASIEVLPEMTDDMDIEIRPEDIKMDVFRSSGAGGQHINKTSSAVRLTHIPTGIVVSCQNERSQFQNKDYALKMLKSKLLAIKERENKETIDDLKGVQMDIAWGSQIRSYVFCPYTMVKDHRTNYEVGDVQGVMDGDINDFIFAYLKSNASI